MTTLWTENDTPRGAAAGRPWAFTLPLSGQHDSQLDECMKFGPTIPLEEGGRAASGRVELNEGETPEWMQRALVGLAVLALLMMVAGIYRSGSGEKFLRVEDGGSTLGMIGIKVAPGQSEDLIPERLARSEMKETPSPLPEVLPPPTPMEAPPPPPLPAMELPPLQAPPLVAPRIELPPLEATRPVVNLEFPKEVEENPLLFTRALSTEDTPMLRNWKMLALYSLTMVTLVPPAPVAAGGDQKSLLDRFDKLENSIVQSFDKVAMDMKTLTSEVMKFKTDIAKLQNETLDSKIKIQDFTAKLDSLNRHVGKLQDDLEAIRNRLDEPSRAAAPALDKSSLEELRVQLGAIERAILKLEPAQSQRIAFSPGAAAVTGTGRVMLVNNYPEELLFIVNNREFRVPAMTTQPIDAVPSGSLNYEVISPTWGLRARRSTTLTPNETFTLTAQ